jgi:hypothetical protein
MKISFFEEEFRASGKQGKERKVECQGNKDGRDLGFLTEVAFT